MLVIFNDFLKLHEKKKNPHEKTIKIRKSNIPFSLKIKFIGGAAGTRYVHL